MQLKEGLEKLEKYNLKENNNQMEKIEKLNAA